MSSGIRTYCIEVRVYYLYMPKMTLTEELRWRGFLNQTTFADLSNLDEKKWTFYHGFDASADSQTIGNLAGMMLDRLFMRHGHNAIILAGGATSLIGDPGGKDVERPLQDEDTIHHNIEKAKIQLVKIFEGQTFTLVNNLDWTKNMTVIDFLRDIGKYFGMTSLIQRDYIAQRLGEDGNGISFTELSYTLLQGMDFQYLFDNYKCELQLSGSDQWGNCLSGVELIRKSRGAEVHALTMPLIINKATGKKFGKSESGAVWLDPDKTSIFQFYQFWLNVDDDGAEDYLKIYTELDKESIDKIVEEFNSERSSRLAQKALADEVTRLVHGKDNAQKAQLATKVIAEQTIVGEVDDEIVKILRKEIPSSRVKPDSPIAEALVETGLATSSTEARRLVAEGAIYINGTNARRETLEVSDFKNGRALMRKGKVLQNTALIELT